MINQVFVICVVNPFYWVPGTTMASEFSAETYGGGFYFYKRLNISIKGH